ncbi:MAG: hypothetical protein HRF42_02865 [Candidatus Brocadia sp.]
MEISINQEQLKSLIKAALVEVLEEWRDLLHNVIEEAIEDVALVHAIEEGESTELVQREEIFKLLEGKA